ncbi:AAA family ATPase [Streptomyces oryzae]|uniref:AAA family ATPase n=1 Tax=Streptomyces oryzae TaxID=1434886 RepID=A0ABS3X4L1_9ACTN|nr:AAA family ATPase [Streptomyces oryzae]MBO8190317.1 AAA family ATPase [Streptomyces oryzae]
MTAELLERDAAHALLASETERVLAGAGRLVLVRGATGTGRTAVLEAAAEHAAHSGLRVLHVRCSREDTAAPFGAIDHLLGSTDHRLGRADKDADRTSTRKDGDSPAQLWRLLRSHSSACPLMVGVDDVHLADAASRRWLADVARRIDRLPILLVITERSQYDVSPQPAGVTHALSPSLVRTHTLAPLTDDASTALVRAAVPAASAQWTADCVRAGAGNPLLLRALLDDLGGAPHQAVPERCAALYPGAYPAAVSWWLDSTGPATARLARTLAILERTGPENALDGLAGLLAEASGSDPARTRGWLTAMLRIGILRPDPAGLVHYAHPLLRDAVLADWPAEARRAANRDASELMLRRGDHVEAIARQLLDSETVGQSWVRRVLRDAMTVAVRGERPGDAVRYMRRALEEPLPDSERQPLLTELGSLEYACTNPSAGIRRLSEALYLPAEPRERVHTALALGAALADRGELDSAVSLLRSNESELTGHPELVRTVRVASVALSDQDLAARRDAYQRLKDTSEDSQEAVGAAGRALLVRYAVTAGAISARTAMTQLRELLTQPVGPLEEPFLLGTSAAVAQWADELDEAEWLVKRGLAGQSPLLLHPMHQVLCDVRAGIAAARGDYGRLLAEYAEQDSRDHRAEPTDVAAYALRALVETGRLEEAQQLADRFSLDPALDSWRMNLFRYARGTLRSAVGDTTGALHDFLECGRRQSARGVVSPVVTPWRAAAAECWLALGDRPRAVALAHEEVRLARLWNTPRAVGRALQSLASATGGQRGLELAEEAVGVLRRSPDGSELVSALLEQGRQLTGADRRNRARECLLEAAERAELLGAERLRLCAEKALRAVGARRITAALTGAEALTSSERRIAELAADGRTNTEISAFLNVARRTVETHLTSTYRKLGIQGRGELQATRSVRGE